MRCATPHGFTHRLRALPHTPHNGVTIGSETGVTVQSELTPRPVPTLGELQTGSTKWVWAFCNDLDESGRVAWLHRAPLALAPFVIRCGAEASSNVMRERLRCAVCGHRGAVLQHPSWIDAQIGEQPFPVEWVGIVANLSSREAAGER